MSKCLLCSLFTDIQKYAPGAGGLSNQLPNAFAEILIYSRNVLTAALQNSLTSNRHRIFIVHTLHFQRSCILGILNLSTIDLMTSQKAGNKKQECQASLLDEKDSQKMLKSTHKTRLSARLPDCAENSVAKL